MCTLQGYWQLPVDGRVIWFSFAAGGLWGAGTDWRTLDTSPLIGGTYTYAGGRLVLREGRGMPTGCAPTDDGTYTVSFASACSQMSWAIVSDACASRGMTLGSANLTR